MYILYFTFSKKKSKGKVSDLCQGIGKKKGPSKPQLFHTQKANGNSFRMRIHMMILAKRKHQKKTWKKKKQLLDFFSETSRETIFYRCTQHTLFENESIIDINYPDLLAPDLG